MKELLSFPLKGNPFFAKVVALASNFNTDGITEESSDTSGFSCQMLGDFKCQDQFPSCSGWFTVCLSFCCTDLLQVWDTLTAPLTVLELRRNSSFSTQ